MGSYAPTLVWYGQATIIAARCTSCGWAGDPVTLPEARLHVIRNRTHTVAVTATTTTRLCHPIALEREHVPA
ncbi:MAG TPA: hypothetical protein VFU23_03300 [Gemmatimonadales bacterium]|nr:hypothetical protein [Gemmatimonadales bacterium]